MVDGQKQTGDNITIISSYVRLLERSDYIRFNPLLSSGTKSNYKRESEIEEEIKNIVIENFLDFDVNGKYEFARCEDCNGPLMENMKVKCPKLAYGEEDVKKFENYLKRIGGLKEAV